MFEFLFSYPSRVYEKGQFVLLGGWPVWAWALLALGVAAGLAWPYFRSRRDAEIRVQGWKAGVLWALQALMAILLLSLLWQPALLVATLKPQQNVVAVVVDDSKSMSIADEGGKTRAATAKEILNAGLLEQLKKQFQVRLYKVGRSLERLEKAEDVQGTQTATRLSDALRGVAAESASVPLGAIVLLSDGGDNAGGIDLATLSEVRSRRIPVHTVGLGREKYDRDLEIVAVDVPARALADSRITAQVTLRQTGYTKNKVNITLRDGTRILGQQTIVLKADNEPQTESILFNSGPAGPKALQIGVAPLENEENRANNQVTRLVNVEATKPRILYIEGEPKWEYKFIRRAMEDDKTVSITSMLRTTQNKIYRQGIAEPKELENGFPDKAEDLFQYQGLIIGGVEIGYFTAAQQELIRQFVDRRGGGLLFLGGRNGLSDGGWGKSGLLDLLPVSIGDRRDTFKRERAKVELAVGGRDSLIARLVENPDANIERWKKLPEIENYQETGAPKPGAVVLAEFIAGGKRQPLLATQNYGRGRTAILATAGTWRWQMLQPLEDKSHEVFWDQLSRWLVTSSPPRVLSSTPKQVLTDETKVQIRAEVRDKNYLPVSDGQVQARVLSPDGSSELVEMRPEPLSAGQYVATWDAEKPGAYVAEIVAKRGEEELGTDLFNFRREDGVAENFGSEQNRELLEKLSSQTGGVYYRGTDASKLAKDISYSEAGITVREAKDLWNLPIVFLLILMIRATEWMLRRRWGVV
ncbi:MAG: glutamine amidotransferase [Bryobacteraceae bacterium]|nr:glutamine amidotransferase [Bryobacteraceae bacterium]